jgi:hypothetical protein
MASDPETENVSPLRELFSGGLEEEPISLLPVIQQKLDQPKPPVTEILRLLHLEHARILQQIQWATEDPALDATVRALARRREHLGELHKFLIESQPEPKGDIVNLDGAKFRHSMKWFFDTAEEALIRAGISLRQAAEIRKRMEQRWEEQLPHIRQELEKMDEATENFETP